MGNAYWFIGIAYYAENNATLQDRNGLCNILKYFIPSIHYRILLSAILASIMSSISSQLLVISSAVTEDFIKHFSVVTQVTENLYLSVDYQY